MIERSKAEMEEILSNQKKAYIKEGEVSAATRIDRIDRAIDILANNGPKLCEAIAADFGHRSLEQSKLTDIDASIGPLKDAKKHLRGWMKPERRKTMFPLGIFGARARVQYQPLGVVGCISPWNFPVQLTFAPLAGVFAAGNRTMIKPSEFTPATSELMLELLHAAYDIDEVAVIPGGPAVGEAFSSLPFDHLLFTGATSIAKHVMRAASENLVPVTLELGGKSPVVVGKSADVELTASNVMTGKTMNAGQICLAPDYLFIHEDSTDNFIEAAKKSVAKMYPDLKDNPDYTSMVNERHYDRVTSYIEDAKAQGAEVIELNPADENFDQQQHNKIPPTLIIDPSDEMEVMKNEIFGPVLGVLTVKNDEEALKVASNSKYGLHASVFTQDINRAFHLAKSLPCGTVSVNTFSEGDIKTPFGGYKQSGSLSRDQGTEALNSFLQTKTIWISHT